MPAAWKKARLEPVQAWEVHDPSFSRRGPVCESGDFVALDRSMVEPKPGDLLAIMSAGAYGAVEASTYNTRALIPEVLVRKGEWALVRPRVTAAELIALDRMPAWL
jgi:diaminopimelate decarboxylase